MSDQELPSAFIRRRLGSEDAHYGGGLVAGSKQLEIVGDLITELAMRYDGDEGLFRAYESVEFLDAPVLTCRAVGTTVVTREHQRFAHGSEAG